MLNGQRVLNLAGRTTIHETAAIIERCGLFIGNDSGPYAHRRRRGHYGGRHIRTL
jgi:hypothetical protein